METVKEAFNYTNFMLDCETTGLNPMIHSCIELALVRFDPTPEPTEMVHFSTPMQMAHLTMWDADTREWWGKEPSRWQNLLAIERDGELPHIAFDSAFKFVTRYTYPGTEPVIWAKNAGFDWGFWKENAARFHLTNPIHYRNVVDLQSFMRGVVTQHGFFSVPQAWQVMLRENPHNALGDCLHQIKTLKQFMGWAEDLRASHDEATKRQVRGE